MLDGAVRKYPEIKFDILWFPGVVESVINRLRIYPNNSGTLMKIVMTDTDPFLAAQTINRISEKFIKKSRDIRNYVNRFQRQYFEEQLGMVQQELNRSDAQMKSFRNTHRMNLDQETQQTVTRMSEIDREINELGIQKRTLRDLLAKVDPQSPNFDVEAGISIRYIYQQIAEQPVFRQDADMTIARQELTDRNQSLDRMLGGSFTQQHPVVREISEKIQLLQDKILTLTKEKIADLDRLSVERQKEGEDLDKELVKLPGEELRLIQLNRQRKANETLNELLLQQYKEAQIRESVASENISIIDPAMSPQRPITRSRRNQAVMGVLVAFLFGLASAVAWEVLDKSLRTREDIKRFLNLPILGVIPKVKFNGYELQDSEKAKSISSQIVTHDYSPTPVGEAYRSLRTSLLFSKAIGPIGSLVIGSVAPGEGKSFTSANLAITMAQQKSKTLLIDADLRRGVLHNSFNCSKKPGLTNYLTGVVPLETILNETYIPNLSLITAGSMIPNPSELLGSPRMQKFIEGISQRYDIVIFDTPPLLAASDAIVLGTLVDGICMIVMAGKTKRNEVMRKMEMFQHVQAKVLGIVLNGAGIEVAHDGYSYYAY
jgi:tyrosine-protein kinase Etk/Wzc